MAPKKRKISVGEWLIGLFFQVDQEIRMVSTANPEIDTTGGSMLWKIKNLAAQAFRITDTVAGEDVIEINTITKQINIHPNYQGFGFYGIDSSVTTTDATPTELEKIDTLTDNSTHLIELKVTAMSTTHTEWGTWHLMLSVTKVAGVPVIQNTDTVANATSAGLSAVSVTTAVNGGDIDIDVTGILATNIQWDSQYEIITKSTN